MTLRQRREIRPGARTILPMIALAFAACGKTVAISEPLHGDGSASGGTPTTDAGAGEPGDASSGADEGNDATSASDVDGGMNAQSGDASDDAIGADAGDSADASIPIPCDETATCSDPVSLPTIQGGVSGGLNESTYTYGDHSEWYLVRIDQYDPPTSGDGNVYVSVEVRPPPGMEFDMDVYLSTSPTYPGTCSQIVGTSTGDAGLHQIINFQFPDKGFTPLGWVTIHVVTKPGSTCMTGSRYMLIVEDS